MSNCNTLFVIIPKLNDDGWVVNMQLPTKLEICPRCDGRGSHDHEAFANGITGDDWNGPDWDDESRDAYMRGAYDVPCSVCNGERVVPVLDRARCNAAQIKLYDEYEREEAEDRAISRAEIARGA